MTMREVDHTNPHTDEPFGDVHGSGAAVAADGGREEQSRPRRATPDGGRDEEGRPRQATPDGGREEQRESTESDTMEDVNHEPPAEGANRAFERGMEGRDETV